MHLENRPNEKKSKAERARRYLSGGGIVREDSDDELGLENHPWQWIYESQDQMSIKSQNNSEISDSESLEDDTRPSKKVKTSRGTKAMRIPKRVQHRIVGARMGSFECKIGDCVLLKADKSNEAWVGLICEFMEDEIEGMVANFMWFSTEKEIRNKQKKRTDFLPNELYICPSWDFNPLASINGKASVMSAEAFLSKYPNGRIPKSSRDFGKSFICRRGCNTRTVTYTEEFIWEDVFHGTEDDIQDMVERVKKETRATRKRIENRHAANFEGSYAEEGDELNEIETPKKRRKISELSTPQKPKSSSKLHTPSQKKVIVKKPLEFTPLGTRILDPGHVLSSPFQIARSKLHVSAVPAALPCRENEFSEVYMHLESAITDGSGACIYISGTPGTGKTATVREVVAQLNAAVAVDELDDFLFVEINGMKVTDPHQSYSLLWEALKGDRVGPSQALDLLEREFSHPSPRRVPCVVLMDELDQLVTKNQSVMYNFFNWPGLRHSRLIVLAVANTMDLPERTLSNKISSRLGLTRITFAGYNHEQLMKIIQSRLEGVSGSIVEPDAVQFASRKVAAVSGDARRALDICRRAVEIAEAESLVDDSESDTRSKYATQKKQLPAGTAGIVTIATIKRAINEATTSPLQKHLRSLPLSSKLFLAAMLAKTRRSGLGESLLGEVIEEAKRISQMSISTDMLEFLMSEPKLAVIGGQSQQFHTSKILKHPRVYSMGVAAIELMESGVIGLEVRKGDRVGKVRLCIGEGDIKEALKDDLESRGLGF